MQLFAIINLTKENTVNWSSTPYEFINLILNNSNNENLKSNIDEKTIENLKLLSNIMKSSLGDVNYLYNEIADFTGSNKELCKKIYSLYISKNEETKITPQEFVDFILKHKNDESLKGKFSDVQLNKLQLIKNVYEGINILFYYLNLSFASCNACSS